MSTTIHQRTGKPWRPLTMLLGCCSSPAARGGATWARPGNAPWRRAWRVRAYPRRTLRSRRRKKHERLPSRSRFAAWKLPCPKPWAASSPGSRNFSGSARSATEARLPPNHYSCHRRQTPPLRPMKISARRRRIARIWIAPFVDAEGVYREAGWVRVVVEPARWRLP